jgi:preprotein translocase subunit SecG
MKSGYMFIFLWVILSSILVSLIIYRDPNVESVGAIIQESQYKEQPEKTVDKIIIVLVLIFIGTTVFLFTQYQ